MMRAALPLAAAHTGCGAAPDNTWESLLEGIASGAAIVEVDVQVCKDGTAVLLHDDSPLLAACDFEELNRPEVRARLSSHDAAHDLVKLEDALREIISAGMLVNLDLKSEAAIDPAMQLVRRLGGQDLVFTTGCSDGLPERYPDIRAMWNAPTRMPPGEGDEAFARRICDYAASHAYHGLNLHHETCSEAVVRRAKSMDLPIWAYTVNDASEMKRLIGLGIAAITTRKPGELQRLLGNDGREPDGGWTDRRIDG